MKDKELKKKKVSHWSIVEPIRSKINFAMTLSVFSVITSTASILTLAYVIKEAIDTSEIPTTTFGVAVALAFAAFIFRGMSFKTSHKAVFALEPIIRSRIAAHLATLPLGLIEKYGAAPLAKVIQDDVHDLHIFVADATPLYARGIAAPILTLGLLLWLDWRLALVALGVLVVGMVVISITMRDQEEISRKYNDSRERVNQSVIEFVQAMPVVRTFDGGKASFGRYEKALDDYLKILVDWYDESGGPARLAMIILNPLPTLLAVSWVGAYYLWGNDLEFSTWLAILLLGTGMAESLMPLMGLFHMIEKAKISVTRINEVQELESLPVADSPKTPANASVVFRNVDFCYDGRDEKALEGVSFEVPEGSVTALVGPSGAGKSTVAKLVPRFWDVDSGAIEVGGVDVKEIDPDELMSRVAFVFQDNFLFSGTIEDNIKMGRPEATHEEVVEAAKRAEVDAFIRALPDGYETQVGERGATLSGGERQRITIARAIFQQRPILILDEATAFADAENEALIMRGLSNLMKGKTVIMIAHRLSTIQNADQVVVFEKGRLVEKGSPKDLLQQDGAYAKLWDAYQQAQSWRLQIN